MEKLCAIKSKKAFTLIELLVVISIISLLSSIVLSALNTSRDKARLAAGRAFSSNVYHAAGDDSMGIWEMDDCSGTTISDRSGLGYTGTFTNGPTWSVTTVTGTGCSVQFDGSDDYITMGNGKLPPRTVTAWIYMDVGFPSDERAIFTNWGSGGTNNLVFKIDNYRLSIYANSFAESFGMTNALSIGQWYHVAYVNRNDGTNSKLYVDGKEVASVAGTTFGAGTNNWLIGANDNGTARFWKGKIDEVRIFNKPLVASDVRKIYAESKSRFPSVARE